MNFFKITDPMDFPLDEQDYPLHEYDIPLALQINADLAISDKFDLSDKDYDQIDNITPEVDKQMQDSSEESEGGQFQNELGQDDSELDMSLNPEESTTDEQDEGLEGEQEQDPNFQGIIRTVKGANLVYKRQMPDNTFTELWIANVGNDMKSESSTKRAILAGTDVDPQSQQSTDGKQNMELYTIGNVQFVELTGLPS
jgi:hypothetical protein